MKVIKVTKEYFETEDEKVYFFEPLEKEISVEDMQKIVDANEKLVKKVKGADRICFEIGAHVVYYPSRYEKETKHD